MSARACRDVRADLSAFLDGDLAAGPAAATRAHIEGCASCQSELEQLRVAIDALRGLPELPPPAAILTGVRARLRPEPWHRRLLDGRQWLLGLPVGALATLVVVVGISLFHARYPDLQQTLSRAPVAEPPPHAVSPGWKDDAAGSKLGAPPLAESEELATESKDIQRKKSQLAERDAATTLRSEAPAPRPRTERAGPGRDTAARRLARVEVHSNRIAVPSDERGETAMAVAPRQQKEEGYARIAVGKAKTTRVGIVCLLPIAGDTVDDLARLLRREGAATAVRVLEPQAVNEAFAPRRGRPDLGIEPSQGWEVTASVPADSLPRLLETLANRPGLRVLERTGPAVAADSTGHLELRLTVLR